MPRKKAMQSKECSCSPAFMKGPSLSMYEHTLCIQCIIYILNSPQSSLGWQNIVCFLKYIFSQSSRWITWTRRNERHPLTEILLSLSELVWLCMVYTHVRTYELYMDHSFTRKHIPTSQQRVTRPYPEEVALLRSGLRYSAAGYVAVVRAVGHHRILVLRSLSDSLAQYDALCRGCWKRRAFATRKRWLLDRHIGDRLKKKNVEGNPIFWLCPGSSKILGPIIEELWWW